METEPEWGSPWAVDHDQAETLNDEIESFDKSSRDLEKKRKETA